MAETAQHAASVDPELKQRLASLYSYMSPRLGIQQAPRIVFTQDATNAKKPFGHTAYYDHGQRLIRVYITERHPTDILRSFAHELIHHWQNEHGAMPKGNHDPAHYAQKNPTLRLREEEAYLLGNMIFRDWQDANRYGPLNENAAPKPDPVRQAIKNAVFEVMKERVIRPLTLEDGKMTVQEIKDVIRERIEEMAKANPNATQNYSQWLKNYLKTAEFAPKGVSSVDKVKQMGYLGIGFDDEVNHFCWYWDPARQEIKYAKGGSHGQFKTLEPYQNFRGRYDPKTGDLSITVPEPPRSLDIQQRIKMMKQYSGNVRKDVPPKILHALKKLFKPKKIHYFPHEV